MKFVKESFPCRSGAVCQLFPNHLMQDCYNEKKKKLDRLRSSVKLSCNQLFLDVFKVVDHTLPGLVSTAD